MAKDPAFLFYSQDFYMGTIDMTAEQVGHYIRLMCLQHSKGRLSRALMTATMGGMLDEVVASKFTVDDKGCYYNERLENEMLKRNAYTESRRRNLSATPSHMAQHMQQHMGQHMQQHMENENEDVNVNRNEDVNGDTDTGKKGAIPPDLSWVRAYCRERKNNIDPEQFVNYYEARNWRLGRARMTDWQAAVRTWEKNNFSKEADSGQGKEFVDWKVAPSGK